jgi:uncharacterized protein YciI
MKYFAAVQSLLNPERTDAWRQLHVDFLAKMVADGHIYAWGRFPDGSGGLTVFQAASVEDARKLAESDPYVSQGVRRLELHEWAMKVASQENSTYSPT